MGNSSKKEEDKSFELACKDCFTHFLVEISSYKEIILVKKICFCDEITYSAHPYIFCYNNLKPNYYQHFGNEDIPSSFINKYCCQCNDFISDFELKNHEHKEIINAADYIYNCKIHKTEILIGFCKDCKNLICGKCINNFHKNHEIDYTKNLEITEEIIEKYENNLKNAFYKMNMKMRNLYEEKDFDKQFFNSRDIHILKTLELLKTFLDLYKDHKKYNRPINYQIISNILNHINFKILRIKNQNNLNTNIFLKINSKIDNTHEKKFKIISFKEINLNRYQYYNNIEKIVIKLIKGDIFLFILKEKENRLIIYKNFKENKYYLEVKDRINDFILLEDGNVVISLSYKILIYKLSNNIFNLEKEININNNIDSYLHLSNLCDNNFSLISRNKNKDELNIYFYIYPNYEVKSPFLEENLNKEGPIGIIQNGKSILIGIDYLMDNLYKILFYDLITEKLEFFKHKRKERSYCQHSSFHKINSNKILISLEYYGLILNIKEKQIEAKIKFWFIECLSKIGDYYLISSNDYICQFNINKAKIYNKIRLLYNVFDFTFTSLVDIGSGYFCGISRNKKIYLFKYE